MVPGSPGKTDKQWILTMKTIPIAIITLTIIVGGLFAQPGAIPVADTYTLLAGEHTPVIHSGSGLLSGAKSLTTPWIQIGYSPSASTTDNSNIGRYNPEHFTLGLKTRCSGLGDSARVAIAYFEEAYDTTLAPFWNGDSSNVFIKSGNFNLADYGIWRFEVQSDTSRSHLYPLRVLQGGYIRMVFENTTADTTSLIWSLTGEH